MNIHLIGRMRLLLTALIVIAGALAMTATPATAVTGARDVNRLTQASRSGIPVPGGRGDPFQVVNYHSRLCLGITGGEDDAPAVQWTCLGTNHPDQYWHWGTTVGGDVQDYLGNIIPAYQLINNDGECLGIAGGSTAEGADAVGWTCLGTSHPDQYWASDTYLICTDSNGNVYHPLINLNRYLAVLGVAGNSTNVGASVVQWEYQYTCNNQFWE